MTQLVKRTKTAFPSVVSDFFTDRFYTPSILDFEGGLLDRSSSFPIPDANIIENEKNYSVELAAPGLEKKDFNVEVHDGMLNISVEKQEESTKEDTNYRRKEFSYSSFSRSFTLPENSIPEKIDAKYENGVLRISLPKKEVKIAKPAKQIKVA